MASQTDIMNLAIYKLAQSIAIPAVTDESKAADVMNRLWAPIRDLVLTERVWPWAIRAKALAMDVEDPQQGWLYRYAYPTDCLTAYALTDYSGITAAGRLASLCRPECRGNWETSYGDQGTTISANTRNAVLVYAVQVTETERFPPQFVNAFACRLAAEAGPPLIGEVGLNAKSKLLEEYAYALTNAGAHAMNESVLDEEYLTPSLAARGGGSIARGGW